MRKRVFFLLFFSTPAMATISRVNSASGGNGNGTGTPLAAAALNVTAGNFLLVCVKWETAATTITGVTDTALNTFVSTGTSSNNDLQFATGSHIQCFYSVNVNGNASDVVSVAFNNGSGVFETVVVAQYSGVDKSLPIDVSTATTVGGATLITSPSMTTNATDGIIYYQGMDGAAAATYTAGNIFGSVASLVFGATALVDNELEDRLGIGSGTGTAAISWDNAPTGGGAIFLALKDATSIKRIQHTQKDAGTVTSTTLAYNVNVSTPDLLLVMTRWGGAATTATISDSLSNTWHNLTVNNVATLGGTVISWAITASSGADTITDTLDASTTLRMAIAEYADTDHTSPVDAENNSQTNTNTTPGASSITPAAGNELVVGWSAVSSAETFTAGTNFTLEEQVPTGASAGKAGFEDWLQISATATTAPFSINASDLWMASIAAFKAVPSGSAPTVTTQSPTSLSYTTATGNGNATSDGGNTITDTGVCWATHASPTSADTCASSGAGGTGAFTASMTSLAENTFYHVVGYATNGIGTSYGNDVVFLTLTHSANRVTPGTGVAKITPGTGTVKIK